MKARHRIRKEAQRAAHAARLDNRAPDRPIMADEIRVQARDGRRVVRRAKRAEQAA
jgi:hypothetical protein